MAQLGAHLGFDFPELVDVRVEVPALAFQVRDVQPAAAQKLAQLLQAGAVDLVEIEKLADLGQREAEPLAAQDPGEPRAIAGAVEPGQALAARLDQAFILVEANRARRDRELAREFGDAVDALRVARGWTLGR
jgi:hypothetical protein